MDWSVIEQAISATTGSRFHIDSRRPAGGGCINDAWQVTGQGRDYFIKLNQPSRLDMFEAEFDGLSEMLEVGAIRVPKPLLSGVAGQRSFLVMEFIQMGHKGSAEQMGRQLALMHRKTARHFGWHRDNTIGSTAQQNNWTEDWVGFFRRYRLGYQIELAARKGIGSHAVGLVEKLIDRLDCFYTDYQPLPSLLHGDLWGGNAGFDADGNPVIFDPATYYGDREADLAMTGLFGGFDNNFYAAYANCWPIDPGYAARKTLYNLYHILNHYNLFGGGYGMQAEGMAGQLLSACR